MSQIIGLPYLIPIGGVRSGGGSALTFSESGGTYTAVIDPAYAGGTISWLVDGVVVAGETGLTFTPAPALAVGQTVQPVVAGLIYTAPEFTVPDLVPPVITLNGGDVTLVFGTPYVEQGANAVDAVVGVVPVTISGTVDTSVEGTYIITYSATDGVNSSVRTRTIVVAGVAGWEFQTLDSWELLSSDGWTINVQ